MNKKKILIIDDSETNLMLLESMFEDDPGVEIISRNSGKKAVEYVSSIEPNLIILDLMMPNIDGFMVLESLKSNDLVKSIPVIIVSAKQESKEVKKAKEMGAFDYIKKPLNFKGDHDKILKILEDA